MKPTTPRPERREKGTFWSPPVLGHRNYRARYFSAELGRFLARDPLGFSAGDANLFRYCGSEPIIYVDPSGLERAGFLPGRARNYDEDGRYDGRNERPWHLDYKHAPPPPQPARAEQSTPTTPEDCIGFSDWVQGGLDAAGLFDPTPACDGLSTIISLFRGEWADAGCGVMAALIPYGGDLAKGGKYAR